MTIEIGNGPPPPLPMSKQCWHGPDCKNPLDWQVGLTVFGVRNGTHFPCHCETSVLVCSEHKNDITVDHMVTDQGWQMILDGFRFAGRLEPTRNLTKLRFLPNLKL